MEDLLKLLKNVCAANEIAWLTLQKYFVDNTLSDSEAANVHRYLKKMESTYSHAIYIRAWLYEFGFGVKPDIVMAFLLMRDAASHGHIGAIYEVGRRYLYGIGVEKNLLNAEKWLKYAEDLHSTQASQLLAELYR